MTSIIRVFVNVKIERPVVGIDPERRLETVFDAVIVVVAYIVDVSVYIVFNLIA